MADSKIEGMGKQRKDAVSFFSIPAFGDAEGENDLNAFLRSHRVVSVRREVVQIEGTSYWSFCIEYVEGGSGALRNGAGKRGESRARVDYQQVLSPPDFALFLQLRDVRKELAAREGVPVYDENYQTGQWTEQETGRRVESLLAFVRRAGCWEFRQRVMKELGLCP